jgi:UDP-N-acetylmuramoyl-L-alanyl-D-glutamate--2,6-diaminopimelate ligase
MKLATLIDAMDVLEVTGDRGRDIGGLAYDSRRVRQGDAFFALAGLKLDGARFVRDALAAGAAAVVSVPGVDTSGTPHVAVAEPRLALAQAAGRFHEHPSRGLVMIGITGTNGKTTTTYMVESALRNSETGTGVIGTTGIRFRGELRPSPFTTPEAPELQATLAEMWDAGVRLVAMEVSSHALAQRRTFGISFDVVIFTNFTQDHLDYHGSMETYLDAKLMLFDGRNGGVPKRDRTAIVNLDDPIAPEVIRASERGGYRVWTYGESAAADVRIEDLSASPSGTRCRLRAFRGDAREFHLPLGRYNAWNAAAAHAALLATEPPNFLAEDLSDVEVPGRLERVDEGQPFTVVVDYAHTPDALERSLAAVREHTRGQVTVVFGCGGDRDRGKRPLMGGVAARLADSVWVTSDNPRSEDPNAIVAEIVAGAGGASSLHVEPDRRAAIAGALAAARGGDVVLIAGKGHETTQTIGDRVLPFDDREVARELLQVVRHGGRAT